MRASRPVPGSVAARCHVSIFGDGPFSQRGYGRIADPSPANVFPRTEGMSNGSTNTIRQLLAAASPLAVFAAPAWRRASKIVSGSTAKNGTLALLDQLLVSGISFATTVLIGRSCGPGELGAYSLGFTVVVIALSTVNALVLVPYTVHVNRWHNRQKRTYAGATLVQAAVLGGLAAASVCAWAALPKAGPAGSGGISTVAWGLAIAIPLLVLREYLRRIAFANFQAQRALLLDVAIVAIQMLGLLALAAAGSLTAGRAYVTVYSEAMYVGGEI